MKPILEVEHISKQFRIHHLNGGYMSLRERMLNVFSRDNQMEDFWALDDVSFNVSAGESIGIIGRNGAGKSTLLKILSKITPPTRGRIVARGRIASLLEVGTGFHPELTGRENIFFNGSLLGMKKKEIQQKFDDIVAFSGTEKFLDTPLKHYSSGMQLRLAFSVAAFLEPEILIIDEVLAVGDAEFQKKCLGKMEDVGKSGRTILFVSHNMAAVGDLCKNSILLANGKIKTIGKTHEIIERYLKSDNPQDKVYSAEARNDIAYVSRCFATNPNGNVTGNFLTSQEVCINISTIALKSVAPVSVGIAVRDSWGKKLFTTVKNFENYGRENEHKVFIPANLLLSGSFSADVAIFVPNGTVYDYVKECISFYMTDIDSDMAMYGSDVGVLNINCTWV